MVLLDIGVVQRRCTNMRVQDGSAGHEREQEPVGYSENIHWPNNASSGEIGMSAAKQAVSRFPPFVRMPQLGALECYKHVVGREQRSNSGKSSEAHGHTVNPSAQASRAAAVPTAA